MRIGIDLGGTKIEALALDDRGRELCRQRVSTPRGDYNATLAAVHDLVRNIERTIGAPGTVGVGMPGSLRANGLVKNANSIWLNGMPFRTDLSNALGREVRVANDANCLAVSEATDGAAQAKSVVFAVILGTGCGGGIAFEGKLHPGPNGVAGEWGHNPLPWPRPDERPGKLCYCGLQGCLETWISGTAIARDMHEATGSIGTAVEIHALAEQRDPAAAAAIDRFLDRLARAVAQVVNIVDPDVIVFGGGVSHIASIYRDLPGRIRPFVFGGDFDTPLLPARFGDSSGVRGAAWLWPPQSSR